MFHQCYKQGPLNYLHLCPVTKIVELEKSETYNAGTEASPPNHVVGVHCKLLNIIFRKIRNNLGVHAATYSVPVF
jgi:hypothetical protein